MFHTSFHTVTGCTQKTGTYLSLEKNTETPKVVVMVTRVLKHVILN